MMYEGMHGFVAASVHSCSSLITQEFVLHFFLLLYVTSSVMSKLIRQIAILLAIYMTSPTHVCSNADSYFYGVIQVLTYVQSD